MPGAELAQVEHLTHSIPLGHEMGVLVRPQDVDHRFAQGAFQAVLWWRIHELPVWNRAFQHSQ